MKETHKKLKEEFEITSGNINLNNYTQKSESLLNDVTFRDNESYQKKFDSEADSLSK